MIETEVETGREEARPREKEKEKAKKIFPFAQVDLRPPWRTRVALLIGTHIRLIKQSNCHIRRENDFDQSEAQKSQRRRRRARSLNDGDIDDDDEGDDLDDLVEFCVRGKERK